VALARKGAQKRHYADIAAIFAGPADPRWAADRDLVDDAVSDTPEPGKQETEDMRVGQHPNGLRYGVVRRELAPGFAHAILLDQGGHEKTWLLVDLYGSMEMLTDEDVADWPIVYTPALDAEWPVRS
jgi:hypothetical protein